MNEADTAVAVDFTKEENIAAKDEQTNDTTPTNTENTKDEAAETDNRPPREESDVPGKNYRRNLMFRRAFQDSNPDYDKLTESKLSSPYVPPLREYDSFGASNANEEQRKGKARAQVGFDTVADRLGLRVPQLGEIFTTLRRMSPQATGEAKISALRVVMPKAYDLDLKSVSKNLVYIDASTGVSNYLQLTTDHRDSSTFVLRGLSANIAKAADDLIAANPGVQVYRLGEVDLFDYETKQMWPVIEESADGTVPGANQNKIWVHKEYSEYWIECRYEDIPKPSVWTRESLAEYIMTLICGRLKSDLVMKFYKKTGEFGHLVDLSGIQTNLILETLRDPEVTHLITPALLKKALYFMARRGTYHFSASHLLELAEEWGLPLDTDVFNILLEAHVIRRDPILFHRLLLRMEKSYFNANARTWLLFLELMQRDEARRSTIVAMYELGYFKDEGTRRRIARIMAPTDAYRAFKAGKNLQQFLEEQDKRYGADWFTRTSLNLILREFFMHHQTAEHPDFFDFKLLLERPCQDGHSLQTSTINVIVRHCTHPRTIDWPTACWALDQLPLHNLEPDRDTFYTVLRLAMRTRCATALSVAFWHGALARKLHTPSRTLLARILLRKHPHPFWAEHPPQILPRELAYALSTDRIAHPRFLVSGIERKLFAQWSGYTVEQDLANALRVAWWTMDVRRREELRAGSNPLGRSDVQAPANSDEAAIAAEAVASYRRAVRQGEGQDQYQGQQQTRQRPLFVLRLKPKSGDGPVKRLTLDAAFDPSTMVKKPEKKPKRKKPAKKPKDAAADDDDEPLPPTPPVAPEDVDWAWASSHVPKRRDSSKVGTDLVSRLLAERRE
ncbi:hypothetical protein K4F52_008753 [Lecanicillium sp. MT-2017a]|nr:hypothetical protein K4F52_008753 [Lecanicillium sp. MT-2017a]